MTWDLAIRAADIRALEVEMERIYTVTEIAEYLKMSKSKLYLLVQQEKIPSIKVGRNVRIRESDLVKWLDDKTQPEN